MSEPVRPSGDFRPFMKWSFVSQVWRWATRRLEAAAEAARELVDVRQPQPVRVAVRARRRGR